MQSEIPDRPGWVLLVAAGLMTASADVSISTFAYCFGADVFGTAALPVLAVSLVAGGLMASLMPRDDDHVVEDLPKPAASQSLEPQL